MALEPKRDDRIELPVDFASHLASVGNLETTPETLAEYWAEFADHLEASDHTIEPADMYTETATRHEVHIDGRVHYAPCVLDALTAAELVTHSPVTIRSVDPVTRTAVRFTVADGSMDVVPTDAVISFGIAPSIPALEASDDSIFGWMFQAEASSVSSAFCQFINAFESAESYERWASNTSAKTMQVQPEVAQGLIQQYVDID